jgi:hypothetical protein
MKQLEKKHIAGLFAIFAIVAVVITSVVVYLNRPSNGDSTTTKIPSSTTSIADEASLIAAVSTAKYEIPTIKDKHLVTIVPSDAKRIDVSKESGTLDITTAGAWVFSGTNDNLQININAPETAEVRLVLDNVSLTNPNGPVINSTQADHTIIIANEGTTNSMSDGSGWVTDEESGDDTASSPNAVLYAENDLVLTGEGSLTVNGKGKHGISSKGDVNAKMGSLEISAVGSALRSSDSLYILGGNYALTAGKDGIHANDNLVILDGQINVLKSNEGLEGKTVSITGGDITINATDDGINASDSDASSSEGGPMEGGPDGTSGGFGGPGGPPQGQGGTPPADMPSRSGEWGTDGTSGTSAPNGGPGGGGFGGAGGGAGGGEEAQDGVWIYITGGNITINNLSGRGDGVDSNGYLLMTGGTVNSNVKANGGDGPLDTNGLAVFKGGEFYENGTLSTQNTM